MAQILNGYYRPNDVESFHPRVAVWRTALSNWNFTDDTGAVGTYTLYTVTGDVYVQVTGLCQVAVVGAGTIEVGIAGNTAILIPQTTGADLDQYETWQDAVPEVNPGPVTLEVRTFQLANGADIIFTIGGAVLTAGEILCAAGSR
jgi:hypothetical protein